MLAVDMKPDEDLAKPDTLYIEGDGLYISRVTKPSQENNEGPGKKRRRRRLELHRISWLKV